MVEKKQKNKDAKLRETDKQRNKRKPKGQKGKNVINKVGKGYVQIKVVAKAPVPVTADINIKVPVNLKLQPRRHTDILLFTSIHLMYPMIHFLCRKFKKIIVSNFFFQI